MPAPTSAGEPASPVSAFPKGGRARSGLEDAGPQERQRDHDTDDHGHRTGRDVRNRQDYGTFVRSGRRCSGRRSHWTSSLVEARVATGRTVISGPGIKIDRFGCWCTWSTLFLIMPLTCADMVRDLSLEIQQRGTALVRASPAGSSPSWTTMLPPCEPPPPSADRRDPPETDRRFEKHLTTLVRCLI